MADIKLEKSLQNLRRVAELVYNLRLECGQMYCPEKETVSVTVKAEDIPPMEVILGWLYPPRFTFQDDGPMFELVEYLVGLGRYACISEPYNKIIDEITKIWLEQMDWVDIEYNTNSELVDVIKRYKEYKEWDEKCSKGSEGISIVAGAGDTVPVDGARDLQDGEGSGSIKDRPDLEMTDDERWKRFEELEKRVAELERSRKDYI